MIVLICAIACVAQAAVEPHGKERLRELAVFPQIDVTFALNFKCSGREMWVGSQANLLDDIAQMRESLRREPDDIEKRVRFSFLLGSANQNNEDTNFDQRTVELCRRKVEARPEDGVALDELGESLDVDHIAETESLFRRAVAVSSNDWRCWACLGTQLEQEAFKLVMPAYVHGELKARHLSVSDVEHRDVLMRESSEDIERAVAVGRDDAEAYVFRATYVYMSNFMVFFGSGTNGPVLALTENAGPVIDDLKRASKLTKRDYRLISVAAYLEATTVMMNQARQGSPAKNEDMPEDLKRSLHQAMDRLEEMGRDPNKEFAAGALASRGALEVACNNNMTEGLADMRHAVDLDPTRDSYWELKIIFLALSPKSLGEALNAGEAWLQRGDSAKRRLLLAKVYQKQKSWQNARAEAEAALKLEPENVTAHLMAAASAIMQSKGGDSLAAVQEHLHGAGLGISKLADSSEQTKRMRELTLDAAIYSALIDKPDEGRKLLREVLKSNPNDEDAQNILGAME